MTSYAAGNTPLTAGQLNALVGQLRRQSRLVVLPPLEMAEHPTGTMIRWRQACDCWAVVVSGDASGNYVLREARPDARGEWLPIPSSVPYAAREAAGDAGVPAGEVVRLLSLRLPETADDMPSVFFAPRRDVLPPEPFFARVVGGDGAGRYGYVELGHDGAGLSDRVGGRRARATDPAAAYEASGDTAAPADGVVLMYPSRVRADDADDATGVSSPADGLLFSYAAQAAAAGSYAGLVARLGPLELPQVVEFSLSMRPTGEDTPVGPQAGTFRLRLSGTIDGLARDATTGDIPHDAAPDAIRRAVESLDFVRYGNVRVFALAPGDPSNGAVARSVDFLAASSWRLLLVGDFLPSGSGATLVLRVVGDGLDYGDAPQAAVGYPSTSVTGPWRQRAFIGSASGTGIAFLPASPPFEEVVRTPAGTFFPADLPRRGYLSVNESVTFLGRTAVGTLTATAPDVVSGSVVLLDEVRRRPTADDDPAALPLAVDGAAATGGTLAFLKSAEASGVPAALVLSSTATGGTFRVQSGVTFSSPLPADASAAAVQAAIRGLFPTSASYQVTCVGGPLPLPVAVSCPPPATVTSYVVRSYDRAESASAWVGGFAEGHVLDRLDVTRDCRLLVETASPYEADRPEPTGGTFRLAVGVGVSTPTVFTGSIPYDATWQHVAAAVEALPAVGAGNVTGSGGPLPAPVRLTFRAGAAAREVAAVADGTLLQGGVVRVRPEPVLRLRLPGVQAAQEVSFRVQSGASQTASFAVRTLGVNLPTLAQAVRRLPGVGTHAAACELVSAGAVSQFTTSIDPVGGPGAVRFVVLDVVLRHDLAADGVAPPALSVVTVPTAAATTFVPTTTQGFRTHGRATVRLAAGPAARIDVASSSQPTAAVCSWAVDTLPAVPGPTSVAVPTVVPPDVLAVPGPAVPFSQSAGGGTVGVAAERDGRSFFLTPAAWPTTAPFDAAVTSASYAHPDVQLIRCTTLGRDDDGGHVLRLSMDGAVSGGTWVFSAAGDDDGYFAANPLTASATASAAVAVLAGYSYRVGTVSAGEDYYPFADIQAAGGPLPAPITLTLPGGPADAVNDFQAARSVIPGVTSFVGASPAASATIGVAGSLSVGTLPATVTRLDTPAFVVDETTTAASVQSLLRAAYGGDAVRVDGPDGGPFVLYRDAGVASPASAYAAFCLTACEPSAGLVRLRRDPGNQASFDLDGLFLPRPSGASSFVAGGGQHAGYDAHRQWIGADTLGVVQRPDDVLTATVSGGCASGNVVAGPFSSPTRSLAVHYPLRERHGADTLPSRSGTPFVFAGEAAGTTTAYVGGDVFVRPATSGTFAGVFFAGEDTPAGAPATSFGVRPPPLDVLLTPGDRETGYPSPYGSASAGVGFTLDASGFPAINAVLWPGAAIAPGGGAELPAGATHRARAACVVAEETAGSVLPGDVVPAIRHAFTTLYASTHVIPGVRYDAPQPTPYVSRTRPGRLAGDAVGFSPGTPVNVMGAGHKAVESLRLTTNVLVGLSGGTSVFGLSQLVGSAPNRHAAGWSVLSGSAYACLLAVDTFAVSSPPLSVRPTTAWQQVTAGGTCTLTWAGYGSLQLHGRVGTLANGRPDGELFDLGAAVQTDLDAVFGRGNVFLVREPQPTGFAAFVVYRWRFAGTLARTMIPLPTFDVAPGTASVTDYEIGGRTGTGVGIGSVYDEGVVVPAAKAEVVSWRQPLTYTVTVSVFPAPSVQVPVLDVDYTTTVFRWLRTFGLQEDVGGYPTTAATGAPAAPGRTRLFTSADAFSCRTASDTVVGIDAYATDRAYIDASSNPLPPGWALRFKGGVCVACDITPLYSGSFPADDGRTVTVVNGYIVDVA